MSNYLFSIIILINLIYPCDEGYIEINNLCFHENDISILQIMIDNSYESSIDLGCEDGDQYCGSPNPYHDSEEFWGWLLYDSISYENISNGNGIVEPLELGIQQWENGRLKALDCGAYIYCQLSGLIPEQINSLTELVHLRLEGNYLSGVIPETICQLDIDYDDYLIFDLRYNHLCPPYPDCININNEFWGQYDEECVEIGDINADSIFNILDIIQLMDLIVINEYSYYGDINQDGILSVLDIIQLVNVILDN